MSRIATRTTATCEPVRPEERAGSGGASGRGAPWGPARSRRPAAPEEAASAAARPAAAPAAPPVAAPSAARARRTSSAPRPRRRSSSVGTAYAGASTVTDHARRRTSARWRPQARARWPTVSAGRRRSRPRRGRARSTAGSLHAPTSGWASAAVALTSALERPAQALRQAEVGADERVAPVDGRRRRAGRPGRSQPRMLAERGRRVAKCSSVKLDRITSNVSGGKASASRAQVDVANSSRCGSAPGRGVDVGPDEPADPRPERASAPRCGRSRRRARRRASVVAAPASASALAASARRRTRVERPTSPRPRRSASVRRVAGARLTRPSRRGFGDALGLEPALGVDRRLAAVGGRRHGLAVAMVVDVAGDEHALDLGAGLVVDDEVALRVDLEPVAEAVRVGRVADRDEQALDRPSRAPRR